MIDTLLSSIGHVFTLTHLLFMMIGIFVGLLVGIIPGLGGIAGMALLLPFLYGLDPGYALGMLMGMVAVIPTGDTFASVLMGIPGSSASQATVLDGFPLAKKGQAARALTSAFLSSLCGGVIGAIILTGFILVARPLVLAFSSAELFVLTLLGLTMVAVLSGKNLFKGTAACGLGLLVGAIGAAPATGEYRMNLDIDYLYDGVPLIVLGLGIFALPEIVELLLGRGSIAKDGNTDLGKGWSAGIKDVVKNRWLVARCAGIGSLIGTIPGLAGSVVDWITYGFAVKTAKDPSQFGKGDIRGVIAPESANNACACGAMVPTLLFGVPGSGTAAVFLGGLLLLGLEPGVSMITTNLDMTYTIIWSLALANILGAGLCLMLARPVAQLTRVPFAILAPAITVLILFAAYQASRSLGDWAALGMIGMLGVLFKTAGWSRPAFLIGFVLAPGAENYFYQSMQFHGAEAFLRPGVLIILGLILLAFFLPVIRKAIMRRRQTHEVVETAPSPEEDVLESCGFGGVDFLLLGLMGLAGLWALYDVKDLMPLGKAFPTLAAFITLVSVIAVVFNGWRRGMIRVQQPAFKAVGVVLGFFGLIGVSALLGFVSTAVLFCLGFQLIVARKSAAFAGLFALGVAVFLLGMQAAMNLHYPTGLLDDVVLPMIPFL